MGRWEEFNKVAPKPTRHEHQKPEFLLLNDPIFPAVGSVWRCSCGQTWKVVKGIVRSAGVLASWKYEGEKYCLSPFNYDQPSPFPKSSLDWC